MKIGSVYFLIFLIFCTACRKRPAEGTFAYDLELLKKLDDVIILKEDNALIAVSGACQGRILTSTSKGMEGRSYGYFNREMVQNGNPYQKMSALGGEGRMWFGPEIGDYSIFFDPNTEQTANTIRISPELDNLKFRQLARTKNSVTSGNTMEIRNAGAYIFQIEVKRKITLKSLETIEQDLSFTLNEHVSSVGFSAETWIKNVGKSQWKKETGLLSIWDLGCMLPSRNTVVIIPTKEKIDTVSNYFTPLNDERIQIREGTVFYRADAQYMNKIGIQANNCLNVFGSYSPEFNLLNIVKFKFEEDSLYVNSLWGNNSPYKGDVINVFNGEVNDSLDRAWPFYEFETSSSAKELKPNQEMNHLQSIYHFEGEVRYLDEIARKVLGVSLEDINLD